MTQLPATPSRAKRTLAHSMADNRRLSGRLRPIWWDSRKRSQRGPLFIAAALSIVLCGSYASIHLHMAQHHKVPIIAPILPHEQEEVSDNPEYCTTWPVESNSSYIPAVSHLAQKHKLDSWAPKGGWKKPPGIKVIGVLFGKSPLSVYHEHSTEVGL